MSDWVVDPKHPHIKRRVLEDHPEYQRIEECVHFEWKWSNETPYDKYMNAIEFTDVGKQRWGENACSWYKWFTMMNDMDPLHNLGDMYHLDPNQSLEDLMEVLKDYHSGWKALHRKLTTKDRKLLKQCAISMGLPIDIQGDGKVEGHASPLLYHKKVWETVFPNEQKYI
jgi:hypothetical protein